MGSEVWILIDISEPCRIRTGDLLITNQLLYRLSYISIFTFGVADLILTNQLLYQLSYTSIFTWKRTAPASVNPPTATFLHFQRR